jgi:hypothetical protein
MKMPNISVKVAAVDPKMVKVARGIANSKKLEIKADDFYRGR